MTPDSISPAGPSSQPSALFMMLSHAAILVPLFLSAGFFSGTETALLSLSRPRREALRQTASTDPASARVVWLLSDPRRLITTIILGNELTNILLSSAMTEVAGRPALAALLDGMAGNGRIRLLLESLATLGPDGTRTIAEHLTHRDIAHRLGCGREMVSRVMKDLEERGVIETQENGSVIIKEQLTG